MTNDLALAKFYFQETALHHAEAEAAGLIGGACDHEVREQTRTKGCFSRRTGLATALKLMMSAQQK